MTHNRYKPTRARTIATAIAAIVATTSIAAAGSFRAADTDSSGTISEAEFLARAAERPAPADAFVAMDQNGDGYVTRRELRKHMKARFAERRLNRADLDGDGMVSEEEFLARAEQAPTPEERFARRDRNNDGVLTADEMQRRSGLVRGESRGKGQDRGKRPGERFKRVDSDGDGRWSEAEFLAHAEQRPTPAEIFARLDVNDDGELSGDELRRPRH